MTCMMIHCTFSYTSDAPELYQRKLGDLAFLVQNYEFAYNCYHTAKRDFNHEHAWFYFAGALVRITLVFSETITTYMYLKTFH